MFVQGTVPSQLIVPKMSRHIWCHERRERGMRPSERHSGDTESVQAHMKVLSQSPKRWGQAAEARLTSLRS